LYEYGLGVSQDYTEAKKWYRKAADAGHAAAAQRLRELDREGYIMLGWVGLIGLIISAFLGLVLYACSR